MFFPISLLNIITSVLADWTEGLLGQVDHHQGKTDKYKKEKVLHTEQQFMKERLRFCKLEPHGRVCVEYLKDTTLTPRETACQLKSRHQVDFDFDDSEKIEQKNVCHPQKKTFRREN